MTGTPAAAAAAAEALAAVLAQTGQLQELVGRGDWDAAAVLEDQRRALLARIFATPPPEPELPALVARLRELIAANERLLELAGRLRREAEQAAGQARTGRRAVRAYGEQAGAA